MNVKCKECVFGLCSPEVVLFVGLRDHEPQAEGDRNGGDPGNDAQRNKPMPEKEKRTTDPEDEPDH
jgi:hypothetical protein